MSNLDEIVRELTALLGAELSPYRRRLIEGTLSALARSRRMEEALRELLENFERPGGSFIFDRHWADRARASIAEEWKGWSRATLTLDKPKRKASRPRACKESSLVAWGAHLLKQKKAKKP